MAEKTYLPNDQFSICNSRFSRNGFNSGRGVQSPNSILLRQGFGAQKVQSAGRPMAIGYWLLAILHSGPPSVVLLI
ncbi:MAG: hypothetical protein C5B50_28745 [Verrucomicrobia bacterium]|nr:MAG: hypothetical protein C5B50_28745 [Verrucomicrobiota bacterium]